MRMTSRGLRSMTSSASRPVSASITVKPSISRIWRTPVRIPYSSSMTRILPCFIAFIPGSGRFRKFPSFPRSPSGAALPVIGLSRKASSLDHLPRPSPSRSNLRPVAEATPESITRGTSFRRLIFRIWWLRVKPESKCSIIKSRMMMSGTSFSRSFKASSPPSAVRTSYPRLEK